MARAKKIKSTVAVATLPVLHTDTAGIDVGAKEMYVCVPPDRDDQPIRRFESFTEDLLALTAWLEACGVRRVILESTSVYWIPVFQILEERGFDVCLANPRQLKNVSGRKSDVADAQWLQFLHTVGLVNSSYRPPQDVCAIRSVLRHRKSLVEEAATHILHMHKSLDQMNIKIHHVLTDITGKSGIAILDAILAGERDPQVLASLRDYRVKKPLATILKSLVGDWRAEHLFTLKQSLNLYRVLQLAIGECDELIATMLEKFDSAIDPVEHPLPTGGKRQNSPGSNSIKLPGTTLRDQMYRLFGTDLTQIPGMAADSAHALFSELGANLDSFQTDKRFASWAGLCPDNRISGGQVLSVSTRDVQNRVANVFRMVAYSASNSDSHLGDFCRRMAGRMGKPQAITATAHKIARIFYHLVTNKVAYDASIFAKHDEQRKEKRLRRFIAQAAKLGLQIAPAII